MSKCFLSEETIIKSYEALVSAEYKNSNALFHLLVFKSAGLNEYSFIDLKDEKIRDKVRNATKALSFLFQSDKIFTDKDAKNNFINPLSMSSWGNNPNESIKKFSPSRMINNITGGGKQWRNIIMDNGTDPNIIKLKHNYLDCFKNEDEKIRLDALSIWFFKFNMFEEKIDLSILISSFIIKFNITDKEKIEFFTFNKYLPIKYTDKVIDFSIIRSKIGNPEKNNNWLVDTNELENNSKIIGDELMNKDILTSHSISGITRSSEYYKNILDYAYQIILMGPPGTSKSYFTRELANEFSHVKRIQFHPQYSYQDFIGGKVLEDGTIHDKKGEFIEFLEKALENEEDEFLLIIEEINRANVSQVFGELIQLLDRGEKLELSFNEDSQVYKIPNNLKIIGTMNTTDRTLGRIDYAIKRRFYQIYFGVDYLLLSEKVKIENQLFSVSDLLFKLNNNIVETLNNKDMVLGHAIFMKEFVRDSTIYIWNKEKFFDVFFYVVLPIVEDYCNGNNELVGNIFGNKLISSTNEEELIENILEFLNK